MSANPVPAQPPNMTADADASRPATVRLGVFSPSVVLGVAAATGALDRAGLIVREIAVRSSPQQFSLLLDGGLDAALTSPDNAMAYRRSAANPLGRTVDVRILAAVDRGLGLSLFTAPGVDPAAGLRGRVLGVDAPTSGFAVAAYELLERRGLRRSIDYEVEQLGTTPARAAALVAGRCTMTMLNAGSDLRAEAAGCTRVSRVSALGPYVGTVLAALGDAVERDPSPLRRLTSVIVEACRALGAGELHETAAEVTRARLGLDEAGTARYLATLADPAEGLVPDGRLDAKSLRTLSVLRSLHAESEHAGLTDDTDPDPDIDIDIDTDVDEGLLDERFLGVDG